MQAHLGLDLNEILNSIYLIGHKLVHRAQKNLATIQLLHSNCNTNYLSKFIVIIIFEVVVFNRIPTSYGDLNRFCLL